MWVNGSIDPYNRVTDEYIVAYIDILGIKNEIQQEDNKFLALNKLYNLYTFSINSTRQIAWSESSNIIFKIFSDNILICQKLSTTIEKRSKEIKSLIYCVAHFQELAASDSVGWLVRGGISIGQLFIDDIMVWGKALLASYNLESNIAIYPRIVLDTSVTEFLLSSEELHDFVRCDVDDICFLNYLSMCHFCGEFLSLGFDLIQQNCNYSINDRVYQKLCWHMNFINDELNAKNEKKDRSHRLSLI